MEPFKTVTIEYYGESRTTKNGLVERIVKVVTTTKNLVGSEKDPITSTIYEYL
jgi:hypothetical protein